jgi:ATP-binding cassette subfamily B protein
MSGEGRGQKSKAGSLKIVFDFWRQRPWWAVALVAGMLVGTALTLSFPYVLRLIIDSIHEATTSPDTGAALAVKQAQLIRYVVLLVVLGVFRVVAEVLLPFTRGRINELYQWKVRTAVFRRVLDMGHTFQNKYPTGDVMERLDHDMNELSFFACSVIFRFIGAVMMVALALFLMVRMNLLLTLLAVVPAGVAAFGWVRLGPQMYALFMKWRERIAEVNNQLQSSFTGVRLVKSYVMEEKLAGRFRAALDSRVDVAVSEAKMEARVEMFYSAVAEGATMLVLWVGGWLVMRDALRLGDFVAFSAYVLMLLGPMFDIGRLVVAGRRAQGTAERIEGMKNHPLEVEPPAAPRHPEPGELKLDGVTFAYGERPVLKNVTMSFSPGRKVGIAGTVGSGKSTLFRLLFRLAGPQQGKVTLGGADVRELDVGAYRRLFGYAPQEPMLFSDTIRSNIVFGREGVTDDALRQIVAGAELAADVGGFAKGVEEMLGERGTRLSGGQKERVAIARALVGRPPVMVFDDATSALDAETERELVNRLMTELADTTAIIVSHRLSVLSACDWVYVLDAGEVKEQGRHEELLQRQGLYWKLYQRQLIREELSRL